MNYLNATSLVLSSVSIWKDKVEHLVGNSRLPNLSHCQLSSVSSFSIVHTVPHPLLHNLGPTEISSGFKKYHMTYLTSKSGSPLSFHVWTSITDSRASIRQGRTLILSPTRSTIFCALSAAYGLWMCLSGVSTIFCTFLPVGLPAGSTPLPFALFITIALHFSYLP